MRDVALEFRVSASALQKNPEHDVSTRIHTMNLIGVLMS